MHTVSLGQQHLLNCLKIKDRERRGENEKKTLLQRPSHPRAPLESWEGAVSREDRRRRKHLSWARAGALPALHSLSPPARAVDAETGTQSEPPHTPGQIQYLPPSWEDPHHMRGWSSKGRAPDARAGGNTRALTHGCPRRIFHPHLSSPAPLR